MSGNKKNNGVHEVGTKDIAAAYKGDTPGQTVDEYLKLSAAKNLEKKKERSKNFSQVFDNPLKGFPYNEDFTVRDMNEEVETFFEGMDFWKVTVLKNINKLKKGRSVIVKARNSSEALKKGAKNMGDPKANMSGYMDAVKDTKFPTNTSATQGKRMGESVEETVDLGEEKIVYQVKGIQKPESDAFTSAAKLMKLKVKFTKGSGGVTLVQLDGTKSNLRKLDGVVRGKSTYGDPSTSGQGSHFDESFVMESAIEHGIFLEEGVMSDMLVDIQDGISAKDLAKEYKIPLSMAKSFLKDYYSQKPKRRNESVEGENMDIIEEEVLTEGKNLIPAFQEIVNTKGAKKIGGIMVDMFTASVITQAYEKVNDKNKANMENSDVKKLVGLAQRIMGMKEGSEYKAVSNPTDATTLKGADGKKLYDTAVGKGIKEESQNLTEKPSMSGSKLTGQEISVYFRKNKVTDQFEKLAVKIALDHDGAMSFAIKKIEKLKKGLSKAKSVKKALDYANYGENTLPKIGFTFKESVDRNKAKSPVGKYKKPKLNMGEEEILEKVVKSTLKISSKVYPDLKKLEKAETINDKEVGAIIAQLKKGIEVESDDGEPAIISRKGSDTWDKVWGRMDTFVRDEIYYIMKKHDSDAMQAILSPYMG